MATSSLEQEVIRDIRRNNGVEEALLKRARQDQELRATIDHLKDGCTRALDILSDELSAKPAHCVLEIIQNAVDNSYPEGVNPTIEIELRPTHLQIWCNEIGFEEEHVRAFCSIGNSTKKNKKGYIGEKGIGAKSMFKVATKVSVQSRGYSFVLDRDKELGMISPIWLNAAVPSARKDWTGMNLDFGSNKPFDDLKAQLLEIKDTILLFIDKLTNFKINIHGSLFSVERSESGNRISLRTTSDGRSTLKSFLRVTKTIKIQVPEPKRAEQVDTEVVLAFPLQEDGEPDLSVKPNIYAFLPLRRVGFKFVLQADFLTAANREDVLTTSLWNAAIRDSLSPAFVDAVEVMRATSSLEFSWPRFLPQQHDIANDFFKVVANNIPLLLKNKAVVKCRDGVDRQPSQVRFLNGFVDGENQPLIPARELAFHYASAEYPDDVERILETVLGVTDMTFADFLTGLLGMATRNRFNHTDVAWLESVCYILDSQGITRRKVAKDWKEVVTDPRIRQLPLIQLRDHTWTNCTDCDKYFFAPAKTSFPTGLKIQVISLPPSGVTHRRNLLRKLGVGDVQDEQVVQQIVELHRSSTPSRKSTLEHIIYLYQHRNVIHEDLKHICLYDRLDNAYRGDCLFMDDPRDDDPDRLSMIFEGSAPFVHEGFCRPAAFAQGRAHMQWQEWLMTEFKVRTVPPIVGGLPTPEFATVIDRLRVSDTPRLFQILRRFWDRLVAQASPQELPVLKNYLGSLEVRCKSGQTAPLRTTFFPSPNILQYGVGSLQLLELDDVSGDWSFLGTLGVSMEPDGRFFLKKLIALSQTPARDVDPSAVARLYEHISSRVLEFRAEAIDSFSKHALILLDKAWYHSAAVVWQAPSYFTLKPALAGQYHHLKVFFQDQLRIEDAPPGAIAEEIKKFCSASNTVKPNSAEFSHLENLLRHASQSVDGINEKKLPDWTPRIRGWSLFPVKSPFDKPNASLKLMAATDLFFVQDVSGHLYDLFRNVAPFLALDSQQLLESTSFLQHVGVLPSKRVSECVSQTVEIDGQPITAASSWNGPLNEEDSQFFTERLSYIRRFLYYKRNMKQLQFIEIRVHNVSSIKVSYSLRQTRHVKSTAHQTWVDARDSILNIFSVDEATMTSKGRVSLAENLSVALDIDLPSMIHIVSADADFLDAIMTSMGIGTVAPIVNIANVTDNTPTISSSPPPPPPPAISSPPLPPTGPLRRRRLYHLLRLLPYHRLRLLLYSHLLHLLLYSPLRRP